MNVSLTVQILKRLKNEGFSLRLKSNGFNDIKNNDFCDCSASAPGVNGI